MKVWLLFGGWMWEGEKVIGVYNTEKGAEVKRESMRVGVSYPGYDYIEIEEWEVDEDK